MTVKDKEKSLRELHIQLWSWLADNPGCEKVDWPGWEELPDWLFEESEDVMYMLDEVDCFACVAAFLRSGTYGSNRCFHCPIKWHPDVEEATCMNIESTFNKWVRAKRCIDELHCGNESSLTSRVSEFAGVISRAWPEVKDETQR